MKIILIFLLSFMFFNIQTQIIVREAYKDDLKKILQLDHDVSFEYFKPLYQQYYSAYEFGKNPDYYLLKEIEFDCAMFPSYVDRANPKYGLLIAVDTQQDTIAGFLLFHQEDTFAGYLDLFLIDKNYRKQGIGRLLFQNAMDYFADMKEWIVEPFQFGNDATLKFYESLGFINYGAVASDRVNSCGVPVFELYFHFVKHTKPARRLYIQKNISAVIRR